VKTKTPNAIALLIEAQITTMNSTSNTIARLTPNTVRGIRQQKQALEVLCNARRLLGMLADGERLPTPATLPDVLLP